MSKGNKGTSAQGQGVVTTKDGSEKANYTFIQVGKTTEEGKPVVCGCAVWSTDSTGKLAFLDLLIKMIPSVVTTETLQNGQKPVVEFRLFDSNTNKSFSHVTYYIIIKKDP